MCIILNSSKTHVIMVGYHGLVEAGLNAKTRTSAGARPLLVWLCDPLNDPQYQGEGRLKSWGPQIGHPACWFLEAY